MSEPYDTAAAAQALGTDSRTLRRFLRRDKTYRNAGPGGRYSFTQSELLTLRKRYQAWADKNSQRHTIARSTRPAIDPEDYDQVITIPKMTPELREQIREQEARLDRRLKEVGLHLSQLNRKEWDLHQVEEMA